MTTINIQEFTNKEIEQLIIEARIQLNYSRETLAKLLCLPEHRKQDIELQAIKKYEPPWIEKS